MGHGLKRSLSRDPVAVPITRQVVEVRAATLTVDGASGVGFGSLVIGDFPAGNILIHGAVSYFQFTGPTSGSLVDTWQGDYGIGTTPAGDATITATDINVIASTALAAATAEVSPRTRGTSNLTDLDHIVDNTDDSLELNLNLLVDDAHISGDDIDFSVTGELFILYSVLGDD